MARGERTIRIKFDGSSAGLVAAAASAKAEIKALADDSKKRSKSLEDFGSKVRGIAGNLTSMAGMAANAGTALAALPAAAAAIGTLAGATPLAVAGMFVMVGAMAAVKLGADGIKAAFSKLTPTLDTLKKKVSSSFETSLAPAVNNLKTILPKLTDGFQQIAIAIGGVASRVTGMLKASAATSQLQTILTGAASVIRNIGAFLAPIIAAFIRIGAVAMPILVQLTSHLGAVGDRFNAFIQGVANDGRLALWIKSAIELFGKIFSKIGDLASLFGTVFGDLVKSGQGASGALSAMFSLAGLALGGIPGLIVGTVIPALEAFAKTPMGQQALKDITEALVKISGVVTGVLTAAFQAIAPAVAPLLKAFADMATTIGNILVPVIKFLAPILLNIANFIQQNTSWITPLIIAIGLWTAAQWLLNIALDANPIGLLVLAIGVLIAIVATIITYWGPISDFFAMIWQKITDTFNVCINWIVNTFNTSLQWIKNQWATITGFFQGIWNAIDSGVNTAIQWVRDKFSDAWNFIKNVWSGVSGFFSGIWSGIGDGLKSALNSVIRLINGAINGVNNVTGAIGIPGIPNIPYLAKGGTAKAGRSYVVGEQGPELFTPGQTGRVTSNAQSFGGAQEINLTLNLGEGIEQRVQISIDKNNRATWRTVKAGGRAA